MSRSLWKFSVFNPVSEPKGDSLFFQNRASLISEQRVNYRIHVYNGQRWFIFRATPERIGHRVGEFAPTRKRPMPKKKKQAKAK